MGTRGRAPYPFKRPYGNGYYYQNVEVKIDEPTLQQIADITGGKYFRATNNKKLRSIYQEIDSMEKSKIEVTEYRKKHEEFMPWVLACVGLLFLEYLFRNTVFRTIT